MNSEFWKDKRVFITGHTGFKGGWTVIWLQKMGAVIKGYALAPGEGPSLYEVANIADGIESYIGDVRDLETLSQAMLEFDPEIVIHMAAQPLVRLHIVIQSGHIKQMLWELSIYWKPFEHVNPSKLLLT